MKTLTEFINEAYNGPFNAGKTAKSQIEFIESYCSKKMLKNWKKGRNIANGASWDITFIAPELVDELGYNGNDLNSISIIAESYNNYYSLNITLLPEDIFTSKVEPDTYIHSGNNIPIKKANNIQDFIVKHVAPIFKNINTLKSYIEKNK